MGRITKQYVESICGFWGLNLIQNKISGTGVRNQYRYSVTDSDGNFLVRNQELRWAFTFVTAYIHNTEKLGKKVWICKVCKQINFEYESCIECKHHK